MSDICELLSCPLMPPHATGNPGCCGKGDDDL